MAFKPKITVSITEKDLGYARIMGELDKLKKKPYAKVGIQGAEAVGPKKIRLFDGTVALTDAVTLVQIATYNEFGAEWTAKNGRKVVLPERSFIRSTAKEKESEWRAFANQLIQMVFADTTGARNIEWAIGMLGEKMQSDIKAKFNNNNWEKLSLVTINGRNQHVGNQMHVGEHKPLQDTGQLKGSIRWTKVMDGSSSDAE